MSNDVGEEKVPQEASDVAKDVLAFQEKKEKLKSAGKTLTIEAVLERMKQTELKYNFKEKGKKHQFKKDGAIVVTFIDHNDYVSLYTWNKEEKKYDMVKLCTEQDFDDNFEIK